MQRIGTSTGGKIAAAINARAFEAAEKAEPHQSDENVLTDGPYAVDAQGEVKAFRERGGGTT
jgi:hypothetical protein